MNYEIVRLIDRPKLMEQMSLWFSQKWGIPQKAYLDSMQDALQGNAVPAWYVAMDGERIVGGLGVIENDFHDRPELSPNVCAVYTEQDCRGQGIAGALLDCVCRDMHTRGVDTLYLLTDHDSFYERYGWEFYCYATGDGEEHPSRMYVHKI